MGKDLVSRKFFFEVTSGMLTGLAYVLRWNGPEKRATAPLAPDTFNLNRSQATWLMNKMTTLKTKTNG